MCVDIERLLRFASHTLIIVTKIELEDMAY